MNFSVGQAFPNYSGSIGGNGNITVRGGPVDPVEFLNFEPAAGGTAAAGCIPWTPTVVGNKIRLSAGTINGVINPAWNNLVNVGSMAANNLNYIIATVGFTSRQVSSITYSTSATIPSGDDLNPIAEESFPSQVKIILGTLVGTSACMVWTSNLTVNAFQVFKETIANPAANVKPYKSWYRFQISAA